MYRGHHIQKLMATSSWIRKMFEEGIELKKKIGEENVFDFSLGNPITEPPQAFFDKLKDIAENPRKGKHRYMPNVGFLSTRSKVAKYYSKEFDIDISANDVLMTVGAAGAINVILKTFIDPKNEVIVFAPYFVEYRFYVDNHSGRLIVLDSKEDFTPDLEALENNINPETSVIIINTPNNPTGKVYTDDFYKKLVDVVKRGSERIGRPIYIISDEPYRKIIYDDIKNPILFKYYKYSIFITSHSKDLALAGERIGYAIIHPDMPHKKELMDGMSFSTRILGYVNAPAMMQLLVEDLLDSSVDVNSYKKKRDLLYDGLTEAGYSVNKPDGSFYFFVKNPLNDDIEMINHLKKYNILAVPGIGFGKKGYFRLSYATTTDIVKRSIPKFKEAMKELKEKKLI